MINKNARTLIIVESPNKTKTISKIFKDAGYNKVIVVASVGHISEIKDGGKYWNTGIDPDNKFKTNFAVSADKKEVMSNLKNQVELADEIYLASDPDREGEAIAWSLKKFLKIPDAKCHRVTFHEITPKAVLKAFESPRKIDEDLVDASHARSILDKMVGYRLSPIARKKIGAKSVGRCQSAGLKLIVDREKEIINFIPEKYLDISLLFNKNGVDFKAKYAGTVDKENKRPSEQDFQLIEQECKQNFPFIISDIENKEKLSNPKPPFTTSTFQQEVSNKLGVGVKEAMSYAQKLFEGLDIGGEHIALITYIRTDSPEFAPEFLPILEAFVKQTYGDKYYSPVKKAKKGENTQDGHEAIRPTDLNMTPEKLSKHISDSRLLKVYKIIYDRTVACGMAASKTSETIYHITCGKQLFNLVSRELLFDGYTKVYNYKDKDDEDIIKETFKKGEKIDKSYKPYLESVAKETTPPARFKEATFIKELESCGIGRPSTFATIVETILSASRGYCVVEDKCIKPTEKGMNLSGFLTESFGDLININYTAEMEKDLDLIANNKLNNIEFLTAFYNKLEDSANKVSSEKSAPEISDKSCPECGKPLVVRTGKYGRFLGCSGYPKCKHIEKMDNK